VECSEGACAEEPEWREVEVKVEVEVVIRSCYVRPQCDTGGVAAAAVMATSQYTVLVYPLYHHFSNVQYAPITGVQKQEIYDTEKLTSSWMSIDYQTFDRRLKRDSRALHIAPRSELVNCGRTTPNSAMPLIRPAAARTGVAVSPPVG
jgi:hypothetical protein